MLGSFYSVADGAVEMLGGSLLSGQADLVLEVQDTTTGAVALPTVLYDGLVQNAPASCMLAGINSTGFVGSLKSISLKRDHAVWVSSLPKAGGSTATVRLGLAPEGANAKVTADCKLTFFPTSTPKSGDTIYAVYRTSGRAVARIADAASVASEALGALPGRSRMVSRVTLPAPRSSVDCENAALALLSFSGNRNAAWQGKYVVQQLETAEDVWPGDTLAISAPSAGLTAGLLVREVRIAGGSTARRCST